MAFSCRPAGTQFDNRLPKPNPPPACSVCYHLEPALSNPIFFFLSFSSFVVLYFHINLFTIRNGYTPSWHPIRITRLKCAMFFQSVIGPFFLTFLVV